LANFTGGDFEGPGVQLQGTQWYFNPQEAGVGNAQIVYNYSDVCSVTYYDTIEVFPLPELQISLDTAICPEGEAMLVASGASQYGWAPSASLITPEQASTIAVPDVTTTYTVAGQSEEGCFSMEEVTVQVYPSPVLVTNSPIEICPGETEVLTVTGVDQAIWNGPDVNGIETLEVVVSPDSTSMYEVIGEDEHGCIGQTQLEVIVFQPLALFTASDTVGVPPLYVEFNNLSQADYFVWNFGNGDTLMTEDINSVVSSYFQGEELHTVTLTAYLNGCPSTYSLSIETYYDSELIVIPNIVTPNGDSKNDSWWVKTQNMKELHVDIYNRWGQQVGVLDGFNDKWNPGENSSGTYYFSLYAKGLDEEMYNREGHFTVLKGE
jgi:gliding motility-associated-like protein